MNLYTIDSGFFKLDGGAMFGVVPKSIWNRLNPADENNMCTWAMRCLLIEDGERLILIDTGIGNKQDDKFFSHYYLHGDASLKKSIENAGFSVDEITDVILTHMHFDHVGGAINRNNNINNSYPAFKKAIYWSSEKHWEWAINPNPREKASFLKENILPISESGQLKFINENANSPFSCIDFLFVNGHTESMMLPKIKFGSKTFLYMADLVPSSGHVSIPYLMSYDVRPLQTMEEKQNILKSAADNEWVLLLEHDPSIEAITVINSDRGIKINEKGNLNMFC